MTKVVRAHRGRHRKTMLARLVLLLLHLDVAALFHLPATRPRSCARSYLSMCDGDWGFNMVRHIAEPERAGRSRAHCARWRRPQDELRDRMVGWKTDEIQKVNRTLELLACISVAEMAMAYLA